VKFKKALKDLQEGEKEIIGFAEIRKERDARIYNLKIELEKMTNQYKESDAKVTQYKIRIDKY
jgi:hypothetical protein